MKIGVVLGTRPEIIKLAPVLAELRRRDVDHRVIHTNQHYDPELDGHFFDEFGLPPADVNLGIGSDTHGRQTARMLEAVEGAINDLAISHVIVQGDTNSSLAGALAAAKASCQVAHVEAGLRSYDVRMPEEINRRLIDHAAHDLFPPTATTRDLLLGESVPGRVHEPVGNTVVDAALTYAPKKRLGLQARKRVILLTLHRPENVDSERTLRSILGAIDDIALTTGLRVLFPAHPRTRQRMKQFQVPRPSTFELAPPQPFARMLELQATSRLVVTDSGGLQEEACVLGTPCAVVRDHTDRPEALAGGSAILAGTDRGGVADAISAILTLGTTDWPQPFGEGDAAQRIVDGLTAASSAALVGR
jgi:UDP-N-acetylglucosamine 2-epimerase (non-hydrolysing)